MVSLSSQVEGQEEEKRQEALLPRLIKILMTQKELKRFAIYHSAEGQSQIDISAINLSELVQSFQKLEEFSIVSKLEHYSPFEVTTFYRSLGQLPKLSSLMLIDAPISDGIERPG